MKCQNYVSHTIHPGDNLYQLAEYYQTTIQDILSLNPQINPNNLLIESSIMICPGENFVIPMNPDSYDCPDPSKQFTLLSNMRTAWEQHVYWTRMLLISIAERLSDEQYVTARLLENPMDIANIFHIYYSDDVANTISQLLTEHLQIGAALITALRDGKSEEAKTLEQQWYLNADQMADAFSSINPYYDREEVRNMLYEHLQLTTQEVAMRLAGNYPADIEAFNKVETEALAMADYFSHGIMRQFPQDFR